VRNFCAFVMFFLLSGMGVYSQTCTISGAGTILWNPLTTPSCQEGGVTTATATTLIIPVGVTLEFDDNGDTWSGTMIEVLGELLITASGQVTINSDVIIKSGGLLTVDTKLNLGSSLGCGFTLEVESGGLFDMFDGAASERLDICGVRIATGSAAGCSPYPAGPIPYCEPVGGFTGPFTFDEQGLPVELLFFKGSKGLEAVYLSWATASELNFDFFEIQKSKDGKEFYPIGNVKGSGTTTTRQNYSYTDEKPGIGKNYYRLKSVDFDGYTEYFTVVMVDFDGKKNFSVYPNPSDGVVFTTETNFTPKSRAFVAIYSTIGSEIARYEVSGDVSSLTLPVKLESGVYFAKYISADFTSTTQVLVK
jgi:hypothetical protein